MAKGVMKGGNIGEWGLNTLVVMLSFYSIYYLYHSIINFFVEISRRSWAAILGGLVGVWFAPSLISYGARPSLDPISMFLIVIFPLLIWTFDKINEQLPQNEYAKTTASFIEGGIMGAIVTTIIANMFPSDF